MPIIDPTHHDPTIDLRQSENAMRVRTGLIRGLSESGLAFLPEFSVKSGRRADLVAIDTKGKITIFEIKSSIEDFRVDKKWHEYKAFCDRFYFATHSDVPLEIFPETEGLFLADQFDCEMIRPCEEAVLNSATRKSITIQFARQAALRLNRFNLHEGKV